MEAQDLGRSTHFAFAYLSQIFRSCQGWIGDLANLASCRTDKARFDTGHTIM